MAIYGDTTKFSEGTYDPVADLESKGHTLTEEEKRRIREITSGTAPLPTGEDKWKQLLAYSADGIVQDDAGNKFKVNDDGTITTIPGFGSTTVEKTFSPTDADDTYSKVLENLLTYQTRLRDPSLNPLLSTREEGSPIGKPPPEYITPSVAQLVPPLTLEEKQAIARIGNRQEEKEALIAERRKAQRRDQALKLGPAAILGGLDLAVQLGAFERLKGEDEKYVDEELARLRKMQADDEMGLSAEEKKLLVQAQMAPVRGMAREERMRREAGEAAMGGELSAADLERSRRAEQQTIAEVGRQSGMTLAQADLAKADQNLRRMEQMIAYKGQRQKQKRAAVSSFAGALGSIFGDVAAAGAIEPKTETVDALYAEAAKQGKLLEEKEATKAMRQLRFAPRMDDAKIREILKDIGIPNASDEFIAKLRK